MWLIGGTITHMRDKGAPFRILVVCSANVCRSPVASEILAREFAASDPAGLVEVTSRGVWAQDGESVCALAVEQAGFGSLAHQAARLTPADVQVADLILTAELAHRGEVVRMDAAARRRTFTLLEAATLAPWVAAGSPVPEGLELPAPPPAPTDRYARMLWWVSELNEGRGVALLGADHSWDIADAHVTSRVSHDDVIAKVRGAAMAVAAGLVG